MSLLGNAATHFTYLFVDVKCFAFAKLWVVGSLVYCSNYVRATLVNILKYNALSRTNKLFSLESNKISRCWCSLCIHLLKNATKRVPAAKVATRTPLHLH